MNSISPLLCIVLVGWFSDSLIHLCTSFLPSAMAELTNRNKIENFRGQNFSDEWWIKRYGLGVAKMGLVIEWFNFSIVTRPDTSYATLWPMDAACAIDWVHFSLWQLWSHYLSVPCYHHAILYEKRRICFHWVPTCIQAIFTSFKWLNYVGILWFYKQPIRT